MIIEVSESNYNIEIGNLIDYKLSEFLIKDINKKTVIITDSNVYLIYKKRIEEILKNLVYFIYIIDPGEDSKSFANYKKILEFLSSHNFTRADRVVAFGGGVVGDLAGFVASTYLRGIDFIAVPTTLLSMVDSSVGGKNGINFCGMKNQVGCFYFPKYVHIDYNFLKTLDKRNINNGLAEIFKYSILEDRDMFDDLNRNFSDIEIENIIEKSLRIKLKYVKNDEKDNDKRQYLNLGHTLAHAIEALSEYKINHGEAVGIGIITMARSAYKLNIAKDDFYNTIINAFNKHGLPTEYKLNLDDAMKIINHDKKARDNMINIILPISIGSVTNKKVDFETLRNILKLGLE